MVEKRKSLDDILKENQQNKKYELIEHNQQKINVPKVKPVEKLAFCLPEDIILVKEITDGHMQTAKGLVLVDPKMEKQTRVCKVLGLGDKIDLKKFHDLKPGSTIIIPAVVGTRHNYLGDELIFVKQKDILAVVFRVN